MKLTPCACNPSAPDLFGLKSQAITAGIIGKTVRISENCYTVGSSCEAVTGDTVSLVGVEDDVTCHCCCNDWCCCGDCKFCTGDTFSINKPSPLKHNTSWGSYDHDKAQTMINLWDDLPAIFYALINCSGGPGGSMGGHMPLQIDTHEIPKSAVPYLAGSLAALWPDSTYTVNAALDIGCDDETGCIRVFVNVGITISLRNNATPDVADGITYTTGTYKPWAGTADNFLACCDELVTDWTWHSQFYEGHVVLDPESIYPGPGAPEPGIPGTFTISRTEECPTI